MLYGESMPHIYVRKSYEGGKLMMMQGQFIYILTIIRAAHNRGSGELKSSLSKFLDRQIKNIHNKIIRLISLFILKQ